MSAALFRSLTGQTPKRRRLTDGDEADRRRLHGGLADEPRQGRLDVCRLACLGRVLRQSRTREGARDDRRSSLSKLVHGHGDGTHKLPIRADIRRAIGKEAGATATIRLEERLEH